MVHVTLLGGASLRDRDGALAGPATQRHRLALLAMLAVSQPRPVSRDKLVAYLWPDRDEEHGRGLLKQSVYTLRRALGSSAILAAGDALWLNAEAVACDVVAFESALASGQLERAVDVYAGRLLDGFHLPEAKEFENWVDVERDRFHRAYADALEGLAEGAAACGDWGGAVQRWRRLAAEEPHNTRVTIRLMETLESAGDRAGALQQARLHTNFLKQEFESEPDAQLGELAERLRATPSTTRRRTAADGSSPSADVSRATTNSGGGRSSRFPLVGRHEERDALRAAWEATASGGPRFALIAGEAGIGKTRIAEETLGWAGKQGIATARSRSYAAEGRLAYAPVTDWLRSAALRPGLERLDSTWLAEVARLLPELRDQHLNLPAPEVLSESWQRQRLFTGLARAVLAAARPLMLFIDDLQWCDTDTLQWLHYLLRFQSEMRLLVIGTTRSEEVDAHHPVTTLVHALRRHEQLTEITLGPLNPEETAVLAMQVAGRELAPDLTSMLYNETEGHPLFIVEIVRARSIDAGQASTRSQSVNLNNSVVAERTPMPGAVQSIIQARFAQLSPAAHALTDVAATIGRDFTFEVLSHACGAEDASLIDSLDELWQRRIIREYGIGRFDFSHDRLREVAYATIGPMRRRTLHRRAAEALEMVHASKLDVVTGQIAAHYEHAGLPARAVPFYERAAEVAARIYANDEAISLLGRALALLATLPENEQRETRELALRLALCSPLRASKGWAASELGETAARARALSERVGTKQEQLQALLEVVGFQVVSGNDLRPVLVIAEQALQLASAQGDPSLLLPAHEWVGIGLCLRGEFVKAREQTARAVALYDRRHQPTHTMMFGLDNGMRAQAWLAHSLWHLGCPDQAAAMSERALALAEEMAHPFGRAFALAYDAMLHQFIGEPDAVRSRATATVAISHEFGFPYYHAWGTILLGWAIAEQGETERGMALMREGLDAIRATGAERRRPYYLSLLAEALGKAGKVEEGLALIEEALQISEASAERWKDAELHRLRGTLLLAGHANEDEAERSFQCGLQIAQQQHAKLFELRAAVGLHQLQLKQGNPDHGRRLVAEIYDRFSEGFESRDLRQARTLLNEAM